MNFAKSASGGLTTGTTPVQVAVKEAAAINFPMDHFIGNWWSASEADVIPAGDGAKGNKGTANAVLLPD